MILTVFLAALFIGLALGIPIAYALLFGGVALMLHLDMADPQIAAFTMINGLDSYTLLAIPFFLIAGEVMNAGGLSRRIIDFTVTLVGHKHGGLGYVAVIVGVLLAALSGSAVADAAALSAFLVPMMVKDGYSQGRSAGLVATAGIIGPIIPPSIPLIFFGILTNTSITKLFLAGVFPGILMAGALALTWAIVVRNEDRPPRPKASRAEIRTAFTEGAWALGLPAIIIFGLKFGIVTPTEAGVCAAVYALFVTVVIYRELELSKIFDVIVRATITASVVMLIIGSAMLVSWMITVSGMNKQLLDLFEPLIDDPRLLVTLICLVVLILGTVIDMGPILLLLTPIVFPIIREAGVDPVYFGIVFVISGVIGLITPPVGTVLAVVISVTRSEYATVARGVLPFLLSQVVVLALLLAFPELVTIPANLLSK